MNKILIYKKSILDFTTDCIVNAANDQLQYGGGVCGAIFKAAGVNQLQEACNRIGYCKTGDAVITQSFNLKNNKFIIHAVGPIYTYNNLQDCRDALYNAYKKSLELMLENNCNSVTFPLISSGIYGYPVEEAWRIAIKACTKFIKAHDKDNISIYFAVVDDNVYELGNKLLAETLFDMYKDNATLVLYETVNYLHELGYEKIRLMTYFSPSGLSLRTVISTKDHFDETGFVCESNDDTSFHHSNELNFEFFNENESCENMKIKEIAQKLLLKYPYLEENGHGNDKEYVKWFKEVLKYARNVIFPYAFMDYGYSIYESGHIEMTNFKDVICYAPPGDKK